VARRRKKESFSNKISNSDNALNQTIKLDDGLKNTGNSDAIKYRFPELTLKIKAFKFRDALMNFIKPTRKGQQG
jgi:hypothetical protein